MGKHNLIFVLSTLFLTSYANTSSKIVINKCCPKDKKLTMSSEGLTCIKISKNDNTKEDAWWWLPKEVMDKDDRHLLHSLGVAYGVQPDCKPNSIDILHHDARKDMFDFTFHVRDKEVRLSVKKDSTFHDPDVGRNDSFPPSTFCVDGGFNSAYVVFLCPCASIKCVRKCCKDGFAYNLTSSKCEDTDHIEDIVDWTPKMADNFDYYRLSFKFPACEKRAYHVIGNRSRRSQLLLFPNASIKALDTGELYPEEGFCGTYTMDNEELVIYCMAKSKFDVTYVVYGVLFLIGAAALLITVIVTAILPEMRRNIHGKMALAHNFMLFIGYTATGVSQLRGADISLSGCVTTSLIMQFSILSAFFWLNVMCVDISWTFSGLRPIRGTAMQRDRKKFIFYSVYAWGGAALISMATIIAEYSPSVTRLKPKFGMGQCFFNDSWSMFAFFYGPMTLLLLANLLLFMYTAWKIYSVKRETAILNAKDSSTNAKNKQKLILYVKLFCLMGVTFVTEVISWAVGGQSVWWYFTDTINILRAVFIFVIFCCKRAVYNTIRDKVLRLLGKQVPTRNTSGVTGSYQSTTCNTGITATAITPNSNRKISNNSQSSRKISNQTFNTSKKEFQMNQVPDLKF